MLHLVAQESLDGALSLSFTHTGGRPRGSGNTYKYSRVEFPRPEVSSLKRATGTTILAVRQNVALDHRRGTAERLPAIYAFDYYICTASSRPCTSYVRTAFRGLDGRLDMEDAQPSCATKLFTNHQAVCLIVTEFVERRKGGGTGRVGWQSIYNKPNMLDAVLLGGPCRKQGRRRSY